MSKARDTKKSDKKKPQKTAKDKKKAEREKKLYNLQQEIHHRLLQGIETGGQGLTGDFIITHQALTPLHIPAG